MKKYRIYESYLGPVYLDPLKSFSITCNICGAEIKEIEQANQHQDPDEPIRIRFSDMGGYGILRLKCTKCGNEFKDREDMFERGERK